MVALFCRRPIIADGLTRLADSDDVHAPVPMRLNPLGGWQPPAPRPRAFNHVPAIPAHRDRVVSERPKVILACCTRVPRDDRALLLGPAADLHGLVDDL